MKDLEPILKDYVCESCGQTWKAEKLPDQCPKCESLSVWRLAEDGYASR